MRLLVSSLLCCVLVGGARAQSNVVVVYPPPPPRQEVVIVRTPPPPPEPLETERQVNYLIAFKNNEIRLADQYWVSGNTLYYVTADHRQSTAPLASVDRALSERLNIEQNVAFSLPSGEQKTIAQSHARNTVATVHQRCCCLTTSARGASAVVGGASRASSPRRTAK